MSTARRTVGVYSSPAPRGPAGEKLCRNCLKALPKGKRHNCSPQCSDEWQCKTSPAHLRYRLQQRDKGICALCNADTLALREQYRKLRGDAAIQFAEAHGIPAGRRWSDWWDADHIVPVIEGGGECGLENYRTLCIPCHKKETAKLAKRIARRRALARPLPLFDAQEAGCLG